MLGVSDFQAVSHRRDGVDGGDVLEMLGVSDLQALSRFAGVDHRDCRECCERELQM